MSTTISSGYRMPVNMSSGSRGPSGHSCAEIIEEQFLVGAIAGSAVSRIGDYFNMLAERGHQMPSSGYKSDVSIVNPGRVYTAHGATVIISETENPRQAIIKINGTIPQRRAVRKDLKGAATLSISKLEAGAQA